MDYIWLVVLGLGSTNVLLGYYLGRIYRKTQSKISKVSETINSDLPDEAIISRIKNIFAH